MQEGTPEHSDEQEEYEHMKSIEFYLDLLQQLKQYSLAKEPSQIGVDGEEVKSSTYIQIENLVNGIKNQHIAYDVIEEKLLEISDDLSLTLKRRALREKMETMSNEKDDLFYKRKSNMDEINTEITKMENNIKSNVQFVDNVIIPQLKAINSTYKEHKKTYIKMK